MKRQEPVTWFALAALLAAPWQGMAEESWGTIKGQVIWGKDSIPEPRPIKVNRDQQVCLKNGPLFSEDLVIDRKTRGVRWVLVWLVDAKDPKAALPIHPSLREIKHRKVFLDIACCRFEPHVLAMREGQTLEVRNPMEIPFNVRLDGGPDFPLVNVIQAPGTKQEFADLKATRHPVVGSCNIHAWMRCYLRIFNHPYFAVTDEKGSFEIKNAPAGTYQLVVWQETTGWVVGGKAGIPITIKADGVTEVGKIVVTPPAER
jgi:hypothetical protein